MRVSKSDCETSSDSRMNQVLLTNEHGDVFKRQINIDECDMDPPSSYNGESEHIPSSPVESEYFYEQYIDYPLNDTAFEQTVADASFENQNTNVSQSPFSKNSNPIRNDTVLNYEQHKLQQLHNHNNKDGSSSFTFFGVPLPSITSLWNGGDTSARKSNSRADIDVNGKSRLRHFRLRPGETVDSFQFSNNIHTTSSRKPATIPVKENGEPTNIHPPPPPFPHSPNHITEFPSIANTYYHHQQRQQQQQPQPYNDPRIEMGGFVPMVSDHRKGFTPIRNPFGNETEPSEDAQESVSTELRPNVNLDYSEINGEDEAERKYSVLVSTVSPSSTTERGKFQQSQFNVSSLRKGEIIGPTKSANGISLIHTTTPDGTSTIYRPTVTRATIATTFRPITTQNAETVFSESQNIRPNIQKIYSSTTSRGTAHTTLRPNTSPGSSTPFYPTFMPNSTDTINLSKNAVFNNNGSSAQEKNALSALVAPGAQQSTLRTSPGRSVITKIFNNNITNAPNLTPTSIPLHSSSSTIQTTKQPITTITTNKLPAAEEYLRTTSRNNYIKENTTPIAASHSTKTQTANDLNDDETINQKNDMEWYYNNYNKSTWKEPQMDPGLYRFRSNSISSFSIYQIKLHSTILILALVLTTTTQQIIHLF